MAHLPLDQAPEQFHKFMMNEHTVLRSLTTRQTKAICSLVWANYGGDKRFRHSTYHDCFSVSFKVLTKALGNNHNALLANTGLVNFIKPHNIQKSTTRAYQLTELALHLIDKFFFTNPTTKQVAKKSKGRPSKAIMSIDANGNNTVCKLSMPKAIIINTTVLKALAFTHKTATKKDASTQSKQKTIENAARKFIYLAGNRNRIEQVYKESTSGRLYGNGTHLQFAPKQVRRAALHGQYEYDFENCHYSIFRQLAKRNAATTPYIDKYLRDRKTLRVQIAKDLNISEATAKQCLISIIYGAAIRPNSKKAVYDLVGEKAYQIAIQHETLKGLESDVRRCKGEIIQQHMIDKGCRNVLTKTLTKSTNKGQIPDDRAKLAHILQGYEAAMLHIALELFNDSITLIQHDGFTSTEKHLNVSLLTTEIDKRLGFKMTVSMEESKIGIMKKYDSATSLVA